MHMTIQQILRDSQSSADREPLKKGPLPMGTAAGLFHGCPVILMFLCCHLHQWQA